jgi:hypothetical protein
MPAVIQVLEPPSLPIDGPKTGALDRWHLRSASSHSICLFRTQFSALGFSRLPILGNPTLFRMELAAADIERRRQQKLHSGRGHGLPDGNIFSFCFHLSHFMSMLSPLSL